MLPIEWLTSTIVRASPHSSRIFSNDLRRKRASPTESASSISRMSGSMLTATENASRPYIPEEYVRIGMSMNSSSSAKSTISSYFSRSSSRRSPAARPPNVTFSRPERSRLKPTPSASSVLTWPSTVTRPLVGGRMPAIVRSSVDLPAPLAPTTPSTDPWRTSKETCLTASISRMMRSRRPSRSSVVLSVGLRSSDVRYVTDTSSTWMETALETDGKLTLPGHEEEAAHQQEPGRPGRAEHQVARAGRAALDDHVAPGGEHRRHRVDVEQHLVALRHLLGVVEHRRDVHPYAQQVGQEVRQVAEVDLAGRDERGDAHRLQRGQRDEREHPQQVRVDWQPRDRVHDGEDHQRRQEAHERRHHRRDRQQHARERR